jgi:ubiquinone/menaquinone biosynthesis C-methylase UbiE
MLMTQPAKRRQTPKPGAMRFSQLDAEDLPFADDSFDATLSGMTFGLLPDQRRAVKEMVRVIRPGGLVCIGAHGPEHYWVAIDANLHRSNKRYIMGYRLEWWPRDERYLRRLQSMPELEQA